MWSFQNVQVFFVTNRMIDHYTNPLKAHHRSLCEGLPGNGLYQWERVSCVIIQVCIVWRITRKRTISVRAGVMCDHLSLSITTSNLVTCTSYWMDLFHSQQSMIFANEMIKTECNRIIMSENGSISIDMIY
jgi:hypothetical protein